MSELKPLAVAHEKELLKLEQAFYKHLIHYGGEAEMPPFGLPSDPFGGTDTEEDILKIIGDEMEGDDGYRPCWSRRQRKKAQGVFGALFDHLKRKGSYPALRHALQSFAWQMEERLLANDHKSGWGDETIDWLFEKALGEIEKAKKDHRDASDERMKDSCRFMAVSSLCKKTANAANFLMMAFDLAGRSEHAIRNHKSE